MRVIIDGLDGTGKTTVSKELSRALGLKYVHFPTRPIPAEILASRKASDFREDPVYLFFVEDFAGWFSENKGIDNVVFDRAFPSTLLYQKRDEETTMAEILDDILSRVELPPIDKIFIFTADVDTVIQRIGSRGPKSVFETRENLEKVLSRVPDCKRTLEERGFSVEVIDTTHLSIPETLGRVLSSLLHDLEEVSPGDRRD